MVETGTETSSSKGDQKMSEWIALLALIFQILKWFREQNGENDLTKNVDIANLLDEAFKSKQSPVAALWTIIENVPGFGDAFVQHLSAKKEA